MAGTYPPSKFAEMFLLNGFVAAVTTVFPEA